MAGRESAHLLAIVVVGLLAVTCAAAADDNEFQSLRAVLGGTGEAQAPASRCCFPSTWQGKCSTELGVERKSVHGRGKPMVSRTVDQFFVDGTKKKVAGNKLVSVFHGRPGLNYSYILAVGSNGSADFYRFCRVAKKCEYRALKHVVWRQLCLPANATLRGSFSLGPTGRLAVQAWSFGGRTPSAETVEVDGRPKPKPKPKLRIAFGAEALVAPSPVCLPVMIREHGFVSWGPRSSDGDEHCGESEIDDTGVFADKESHYESYLRRRFPRPHPRPHHRCGVGFASSSYYSDVQTRITDPSVFVVPSYCKKTPGDNTLRFGEDSSALHMEEDLPTILEHFVVL